MSTSKLQIIVGDRLDQDLPEFRIRENYRPDWLISSDNTRLELDFFIEETLIAFEVQGEQHYKFVPFFHKSEDDFRKHQLRDQQKRDLCEGKGIKLIEIFTEIDVIIAIKNIREKHCTQPTFCYGDDNLNRSLTSSQKKHIEKRRIKELKASGLLVGTHKDRRRAKINNPEVVAKRLKVCIDGIKNYENGTIIVPKEKYEFWKKCIDNNGLYTE